MSVHETAPVPEIVRTILAGLPEWFGIPESTTEYIEASRTLPTLLATAGSEEPVDALLHDPHFPESTEIYLLAVTRPWHRHGVGRALVDALVARAAADGARLMSVKTLGPSHPDVGYTHTRAFYRACGFLPVEELHDLWDGNPCLIMVRPLRAAS